MRPEGIAVVSIGVGVMIGVVVWPVPSWGTLLSPHASSTPSFVMAKESEMSAAIATMCLSPLTPDRSTLTGSRCSCVSPVPSSPWLFLPQAHRTPSLSIASV